MSCAFSGASIHGFRSVFGLSMCGKLLRSRGDWGMGATIEPWHEWSISPMSSLSFPGKHGPPVRSCETAAVLHNASWWAGVAGWKHTWVSVPLGVGAYTFLGTNLVCCACCNFSLCRQVCSNIPVMENNFNTQMSVTVWLYLPETSDSWQPDCPNQAWKFFLYGSYMFRNSWICRFRVIKKTSKIYSVDLPNPGVGRKSRATQKPMGGASPKMMGNSIPFYPMVYGYIFSIQWQFLWIWAVQSGWVIGYP